MGMELYASSTVAQRIWDAADRYVLSQYGMTSLYKLLMTSLLRNRFSQYGMRMQQLHVFTSKLKALNHLRLQT